MTFLAPRYENLGKLNLMVCDCSEWQLENIGCDCNLGDRGDKKVEVFIDGYASDHKGFFSCSDRVTDEEIHAEVRRRWPYGRVYHIARPRPAVVEKISEEYCRMMSQNDNS